MTTEVRRPQHLQLASTPQGCHDHLGLFVLRRVGRAAAVFAIKMPAAEAAASAAVFASRGSGRRGSGNPILVCSYCMLFRHHDRALSRYCHHHNGHP